MSQPPMEDWSSSSYFISVAFTAVAAAAVLVDCFAATALVLHLGFTALPASGPVLGRN
jgi:hypothetical protein